MADLGVPLYLETPRMTHHSISGFNSSPPKKPGNFAPHLLPLEGTHPASCLLAFLNEWHRTFFDFDGVFFFMSSILHPRNKFVVYIYVYLFTDYFSTKQNSYHRCFPKLQNKKLQQVCLQQPFSNSFFECFWKSRRGESTKCDQWTS